MEKNIEKLIEVLMIKPFVLESLDKDNQISFGLGFRLTLSGLNEQRINFVHKNPIYQDATTAKFEFYAHDNKSLTIQITDKYEDAKTLIKVVFENAGNFEENYFVLKSLL